MNEDRKKRGIKNHKILMTVAICALFLGSSNTFAARSTSHENHGVTEQMQSVAVRRAYHWRQRCRKRYYQWRHYGHQWKNQNEC